MGQLKGKKHDSGMLADSNLLTQLQQHPFSPNGQPLCVYGDPAYLLRIHLQGPFKGANLTPLQRDYNKSMSQVHTSVEWVFGEIVDYFRFRKNLKIRLSAVFSLLTNAHTCLYKSMTSSFFELDPPHLEYYIL